ncbi:MAG TPA: PilZ domain-containing protein [Rhizomicrobium sp.]|nr:PilZ domain-containing protein [Rhizomicrobium sp.]
MGFSFDIKTGARFAASDSGGYDAIRERLFGKPRQHMGLRIKSSPHEVKIPLETRPKKPLKRKPLRFDKAAATAEQHDEHASELVRRRTPVEYLGFCITNEQEADGRWVASFVRTGDAADCVQRTASHPASYMSFAEAKRQIDATLSEPANNRKYQRALVALEGAIFASGIAQQCQILDLSPGGARLRRDNPAPLEGELHLYIKGFGRFRIEIVRSNDAEVAVRFAVDNDAVMGLLKGLSNYVNGYDTTQTKERKEVRVPTSIAAVCRMADGAAIPCEIIDASMRSMSIRISERPRIGSLVTLGHTKVRVVRHHSQGIAVQLLPAPSAKSSRFGFKEE